MVGVIDFIGMTLLDGPHIVDVTQFPGPGSGVTGLAVLAESHVSVHTWPELAFAQVDIFSCRAFDIEQVRAKVIRDFGIPAGGVWSLALQRPLGNHSRQMILQRIYQGKWIDGLVGSC